ncbi:MAG: Clp1/GlmU family protein [Candidatus Bathyarchaeota archaeon]|nr:Clp1/GlmU family protein [Candidatus Bathyarchaeota archaeon]
MKKTVNCGKTLLVDGPASLNVIRGKVRAFGYLIGSSNKILVPEGKRLPFFVEEQATFDLSLGENSQIEEVQGDTIPESWVAAFEEVRRIHRGAIVVIMVIGSIDTGKSSLCTYLINRLLGEKFRVAILDGDLGQSALGPPTTLAYARVENPVVDLLELKAEEAFFVGATSPSENLGRTMEGFTFLVSLAVKSAIDFLVVNTDGWVLGEDAVKYKVQLAEKLSPDIIIGIQNSYELEPLLVGLDKFKKVHVTSPPSAKEKTREKRRNIRERGYVKYLVGAKIKEWRLSGLTLQYLSFGTLKNNTNKGCKGLLIGLHDNEMKFLGIGVMQNLDWKRGTLKVLTAINTDPAYVVAGKVWLDEKLHETYN